MEISVIMPVYNAERFIAMAIDSALAQEEVKEIIIVEDNSPDNALTICEAYAAGNKRIVLLRHPDGENHGTGASFNLGIKHARYRYVAFLGADDQYVPNRFKSASRLFDAFPDAHGVYAHIGAIYYDTASRDLHLKRIPREVSGMHESIQPADLFLQLLRGTHGHISLDSLVVKREILTNEFLFDESLRLGQDTDFMYRLTSKHRLYAPEEMEIVALRGVHPDNRVFQFDQATMYRQRVLYKCIVNNFYQCKDRQVAMSVIKRYLEKTGLNRIISHIPLMPHRVRRTLLFLMFSISHPQVALYLLQLPGPRR